MIKTDIMPLLIGAALIFNQDEQFTKKGMSDAKSEGLITNRNHDDNLTTERLWDQRGPF